jgi:hypothetical protein
MVTSASKIRDTLRQFPEISADTRHRAIKAAIEQGHLVDDLTPHRLFAGADMTALKGQLSAADSLKVDPNRRHALERVRSQLRRFGYGDLKDSEIVDTFRLDQVLANSADITRRIALKLEMKALQLLPRIS